MRSPSMRISLYCTHGLQTLIRTTRHWAFHAPNPDTLDFESGAHDFSSIFTIAKEVGLYIIFRGGPYVK